MHPCRHRSVAARARAEAIRARRDSPGATRRQNDASIVSIRLGEDRTVASRFELPDYASSTVARGLSGAWKRISQIPSTRPKVSISACSCDQVLRVTQLEGPRVHAIWSSSYVTGGRQCAFAAPALFSRTANVYIESESRMTVETE